jgi:hypothetical protein
MVEITYKGETRNIPKRYLPDSLSDADKKKQIKSIFEGTKRPDLKSYESKKKSSWTKKFKNKYKTNIMDLDFIYKNIMEKEGVDLVLNKGRAAYFSSGSRPEVNKEQWAFARLASVIMGGPARRVDKKIWNKHKK